MKRLGHKFASLVAALQVVACFWCAGPAPGWAASTVPSRAPAKRILLLYSYGFGSKGVEIFTDSFRDFMTDHGLSVSDIYFEYLDLERNRDVPRYRQFMQDLLRAKYGGRPVGLVVTVQQPALNFLLDEGREIAPGAPAITLQAAMPATSETGARRFVSLFARFDIRGTLERALELFPDTRRVLFVAGSSDADRKVADEAASIAAAWKGRLELEYTVGRSLKEILQRVASLPPKTVIIFTQFNRDAMEQVTVSYEVERKIVQAANAPVFGLYDFNLHDGGIGGSVIGVRRLGQRAGEMALELLNGKLQLSQAVTSVTPEAIPMFDWRQIDRWGGDSSRLPENTVYVNREQTFWARYRVYVIGLAAFLLLQSALIAGLLIGRRRRRRVEHALRDSETSLAITLHSIGDAVIATDASGRVTRMNPTAEHLSGWTLADARDRPLADVFRIISADTRRTVADPVQRVMAHGQVVGLANHTVLLARDGREYQIADSAAPIRNAAGTIVGVVLVFSDVTEKYRVDETLRRSEERLQLALEATSEGLWDWNLSSGAVYRSSRYYELVGRRPDKGASDFEFFKTTVDPEDLPRVLSTIDAHRQGLTPSIDFDYRLAAASDPVKWLRVKGRAVERDADGVALRMIGTLADITQNKMAEEEINSLAFYDPLTGLPNRRLLFDRLSQCAAAGSRSGKYAALLLIDLDNFKTLNDTHGHDVGDLLLQQVAQRLAECARKGDTVARLGGDEFILILEDLSRNLQEAATLTEKVGMEILHALRDSYRIGLNEHRSTASMGATLFVGARATIDELLKQADLALYKSKEKGRNTLSFFDPAMQTIILQRSALEAGLRKAIVDNQLVLHYQPQVAGEGEVTGVEALVRWRHPERGTVSPIEFISLAEDTGLILPLGRWVLEAACDQLALWAKNSDLAHLTMAVNVSARQIREPYFVEEVLAVVGRAGANPHRLKLELTESLLVDNVEDIIEKMFALKAKGVGFSLDDFGTGYSSLSYLKLLPLDQLKIDRSFVRDILVDPNDAAIARTIVALAATLGLGVIAEGVETRAQKDFLAKEGCHAYQGYLFSRPLPLEEFEEYVRRAAAAY